MADLNRMYSEINDLHKQALALGADSGYPAYMNSVQMALRQMALILMRPPVEGYRAQVVIDNHANMVPRLKQIVNEFTVGEGTTYQGEKPFPWGWVLAGLGVAGLLFVMRKK